MEWLEEHGRFWNANAWKTVEPDVIPSVTSTSTTTKTAMPIMAAPSVPQVMMAFLAILALWKFPRVVSGFDPNRYQSSDNKPGGSSNNNANPMFASPPRPSSRASSSCGADADAGSVSLNSVASGPESTRQQQEQHRQQSPTRNESSPYMKSHAPESTSAERHRFLVARNGNEEAALKNLQKCLEWRKAHAKIQDEQEQIYQHKRDELGIDLYDWIVASQTALVSKKKSKSNINTIQQQFLPRIARSVVLLNGQEATDVDGHRIIHLTPAQIDDQICSLQTYALAIAIYLDRKADRHSPEKIMLTLDLRPGQGWKNIPGLKLIPFIKDIVKLLLTIFPERLHKCLIYPLPFTLSWIFSAIKVVIDPETANKLYVLSGSAGVQSPLPMKKLVPHIHQDVAVLFEQKRLEAFLA